MGDRSREEPRDDGRVNARLFGDFTIDGADSAIVMPAGRKVRALLAYLISTAGERISREWLASLLWSDRGEEQARASLRQALYELRGYSSEPRPLLTIDRTHVRVDPEMIGSDLDELRASVSDTVRAAGLVNNLPLDFLAGYDGISSGYDEWLRAERMRRHDERRSLLLTAGRAALASGDSDGAFKVASSLISIDATDEGAAQLGMESYNARADRDGARRIYTRLEAALRDDLAIEPSPATKALLTDPQPQRARIAGGASTTSGSGHEAVSEDAARIARSPLNRRSILIGVGVTACTAVGIGGWRFFRAGVDETDMTIAVLPLTNLSGDPKRAYFADGITDEIRNALKYVPALKVIGRTSAIAMRDMRPGEIASKYGVGSLVTGSVQLLSNHVRVSVQLTNAKSGEERWSQIYDRAFNDVPALEQDIAYRIAGALSARLGGYEPQHKSSNPRAYDLYLQLNALAQEDVWQTPKMLALADEIIALDPTFSRAYSRRSYILLWQHYDASSVTERLNILKMAGKSARRAIELSPRDRVGYSALATCHWFRLEIREALNLFKKGREFGDSREYNSNNIMLLAEMGAQMEAMSAANYLVILDPLSSDGLQAKAYTLLYARRYSDCISFTRSALSSWPDDELLKSTLILALIYSGQAGEAMAMIESMPTDLDRLALSVLANAAVGRKKAADDTLAHLKEAVGDVAMYQYAQIYAQRGDKEMALSALERAWELRDPGLTSLRTEPFFDSLREEPRYKAVLAKLNLPT